MKELFHPNVVTLRHAFYTQGDKVSEMPTSTDSCRTAPGTIPEKRIVRPGWARVGSWVANANGRHAKLAVRQRRKRAEFQ